MKFDFHRSNCRLRQWAVAAWLLCLLPLPAQELLLREVISREYSLHVEAGSEGQELISREYSLSIENGSDRGETLSRELSLVVSDSATPPQVNEVAVVTSPTGDQTTLVWTDYNSWQYQDIAEFRIYLSDTGPITDVSVLTPALVVGGETTTATLDGLTEFTDHFLAVVAVDAGGRFEPLVNYSAAYVLSPEVISREVSLFVGQEPASPYREVISREFDLAVTPSTAPPAINDFSVVTSPSGDSATLDWTSYNQWANAPIQSFAIYLSDTAAFSNVNGMPPFALVSGGETSVTLDGLTPGTDHYFAVVPVDTLGNFNPEVDYGAAYVLSPEVISRELSLFVGQEPSSPYREVVSREFDILVPDSAIPAPVTGPDSDFFAVTSTTDFGAIALDFSSYNESAQLDVIGYDVYVAENFFDDVTGLTPFTQLPARNLSPTLVGLPGGVIRHFAVVAVDALGGFDPLVRSYSALTSISGVGEVINLAGTGTDTTLSFSWEGPENAGAFLQGYQVTLGNNDPIVLPLSQTSFSATGLNPATGYSLRVSTIDVFGNASAGNSLSAATWLPNPDNTLLSQVGSEVLFSWNPAQPQALVSHYEIFQSASPITNINGLTPLRTTTGLQVSLGTALSLQNQYFAVATENSLGTTDPSVTSLWATKQSQSISFEPVIPGATFFPLQATSSSGLPVRFQVSPSQIAQIEGGSNLQIFQGGPIQLDAIQDGDDIYWAAQETQTLRLPPVITALTANGAELTNGTVITQESEIRVEARDVEGIFAVEFFGRSQGSSWTLLHTDNTPNDGFTTFLPVDALPNGDYEVRVRVSTPGGFSSERIHAVSLGFRPSLALTLGDTLSEGETMTGQVSIGRARSSDLLVTIASSRPSQLDAGGPVTIPAGSTSAAFTITATQDVILESFTEVRVTASTTGSEVAEALVTLLDDDTPILTLTVDRSIISEADGSQAITARLERDPVLPSSLTVELSNMNTLALTLPSQITIPGGEASASFPIAAKDNEETDGTRSAAIRGLVYLSGELLSTSNDIEIEIGDDEGPTLSLEFAQGWVKEGEEATATIRRSGATDSPLTVTLTPSLADELDAPAIVTIPAGSSELDFTFSGQEDGESDGNQDVLLTASANNFNPAQLPMIVTDLDLPDLVVTNLSAPSEMDTESYFRADYRISNDGNSSATSFLQRVYLSDDPVVGEDILLNQYTFPGILDAGVGFDRSETVRAPREAGTYWLIVTTDAINAVDEIIETNNTTLLTTPIEVEAAYTATVTATEDSLPANTPVNLTGSAWKGGSKEPHVMVNLHIRVDDTERIIAALTNSTGDFTIAWDPLLGEGGSYQVGAVHPGTDVAPTQDTFTILTLDTDFPEEAVVLDESSSASFTGTLSNPTSQDLTGLAVTALDAPDGLTFDITLPADSLAPGAELQIGVVATASSGYFGDETVSLEVTTEQGITLNIPITVEVRQLLPNLTVTPGTLRCSVVRGSQKIARLQLENTGGAETGPIEILLPDLAWLNNASPGTLPSIPAGESAEVSLLLNPSSDEELTLFEGNLILRPNTGDERNVPFALRVVSDLTGDLEVSVVDEYFYFTEEKPKVAGATVVVRDAISAEELVRFETGTDGLATFPNLLEGWYSIEVDSPNHTRFRDNFSLDAGETNREQIFITRELVTYNWTVEEIEIEDRYRVSVETTFETNVPAPVVTVSPAQLDVEDLVTLGQTKVINFTIENHGLIAANSSFFTFDDHPFYEITPLIERLGGIPAKSSIVVPVEIRRIGVYSEEGNIQSLTEKISIASKNQNQSTPTTKRTQVPCSLGGTLEWAYTCADIECIKTATIPASGVDGHCPLRENIPTRLTGRTVCIDNQKTSATPVLVQETDSCCNPGRIIEAKIVANGGDTSFVEYTIENTISDVYFTISRNSGLNESDFLTQLIYEQDSASGTLRIPFSQEELKTKDGNYRFLLVWDCDNGFHEFNLSVREEAISSQEKTEAVGVIFQGSILPTGFDDIPPSGVVEFLLDQFLGLVQIPYYFTLESTIEADKRARFWKFDYGIKLDEQANKTMFIDSIKLGLEQSVEEHPFAIRRNSYWLWDANWEVTLFHDGTATKKSEKYNSFNFGNKYVQVYHLDEWVNQNEEVKIQALGNRFSVILPTFQSAIHEGTLYSLDIMTLNEGHKSIPPPSRKLKKNSPTDFRTKNSNSESSFSIDSGVCAKVKLRVDQEAVLTRSAFKAALELNNNIEDTPLTAVGFDLDVRDASNQSANEAFNIQVTNLTDLNAIDGTGTIPASSTGSAEWTLIPSDTAAPFDDTVYTIGGTITYNQGGTVFSIPVEPAQITVRPDAALYLKYFHQRDVFSDDPHTDPIEASIPYSLAVLIENQGAGDARNLSITSAQPEIVENEKGLLIDFQIIATEVAGQNLSPSLTADFGDIPAGENAIGTWLMTSSLQGLFIDYDATFEHLDGFGDPRLSLIKEVEIHEMVHMIEALGDKADGQPDFLVNDIADINDYPDTVHYSDGGTAPVTVIEEATTGPVGQNNLSITLDATLPAGWAYLRVPDPANGQFRLASVQRSDGLVIPLDKNVWVTDRTLIGLGRRPIYENILHLTDCDSTGQYTLTYEPIAADVTPPESAVTTLPAQSSPFIPVTWNGSDNEAVASFDIFVSIDGGTWSPWLTNTTRTASVYQGEANRNYQFYSKSYDLAGNAEIQSEVADTSTSVTLINQAPLLSPLSDITITEGETLIAQVNATDPDGETGLTYSVSSNREGLVIDSSGQIRWITGESDGGATANVTVTVTDSAFPTMSASGSFTVTVSDENSLPILQTIESQTIAVDESLIITAVASDRDVPTQSLQFSLAEAPAGMTIDPVSGLLLWSPSSEQADLNHPVEVVVTDSGIPAQSSSVSFSVLVPVAPDSPPNFTSLPSLLWFAGENESAFLTATDPDGDPVTITANLAALGTGSNLNGSSDNGQATLTWNIPEEATLQSYQVPLTATANGLSSSATLQIQVEERDLYWAWAREALAEVTDPADFEQSADPDGDGRINVIEFSVFTDPLQQDQFEITADFAHDSPWLTTQLGFYRRKGSENYVEMYPSNSFDLTAWGKVPKPLWSGFIDPEGDRDNWEESEEILMEIFGFYPEGIPEKQFFRIEIDTKEYANERN